MQNVVSIAAFRTFKECQKLYTNYRLSLYKMEKADLLVELERYRQEAGRYPSHLLTIVKGEILLEALRNRALTQEMQEFALKEAKRIKKEITKRLANGSSK